MADNENINFTTDIIDTEIYEQDIGIIDETKDVVVETEIKTIEVFEADVAMVESDSAFSPIGEANELLRHTLLTERDVSDQHPITAITGLRDELDGIKALKTVYADKMGIANYYKWNNGAYNEYGYFVSLVPHTSTIKICDGADIFGVTVDVAGFIGGQDESVPRDNTYALVAASGLVSVRCETTVVEGDYVVSNAYGRAEKTDSSCGYKVVTIENKNGTNYALISLGIQACTTDMLGQQIQHLDGRMDDAENNIVAAMNVANAAYNKAGEVGTVSEEAIKNALEALNKSNETDEKIDNIEINVSSANEIAVQAKAIAESAVVSAETIRNEAVKTANEALTDVNNLIEDLEPIYEWEDPITRNTGAEYFVTYIKDGVATKLEVQTVESLTSDNKSAIEKNAEEFSSFVSSVDKYSVGEYSQAYGLTHEQAKSILKVGMVYIPADNPEGTTHIETYEGQGQDNYFTEGRYYEWDGDDWQEHTVGRVWSSNTIPANSNGAYKYWYVDSNEAPEGYEAHALYIYDEGQWKKVNILEGNVNNRITSMVRQTVDEISAEVTNARGSAASLGARITDTEAIVQNTALWAKGKSAEGEELYNIATVKQTASGDGSNLALVVADTKGNKVVNGASIVLNNDDNGSSISLDADYINFNTGTFKLDADYINLKGYATINDGFSVDENGYMNAKNGGTIGGFTIGNTSIHNTKTAYNDSNSGVYLGTDGIGLGKNTFHVTSEGYLQSTSGNIGGWLIDTSGIHSENLTNHQVDLWAPKDDQATTQWIFVITEKNGLTDTYPFILQKDGTLRATKAQITGSGKIGGWTLNYESLYYTSAKEDSLYYMIGADNSMFMIPGGSTASTPPGGCVSPGGADTNKWALVVGSGFGVLTTGTVYCNDMVLTSFNDSKIHIGGTDPWQPIVIDCNSIKTGYSYDGIYYGKPNMIDGVKQVIIFGVDVENNFKGILSGEWNISKQGSSSPISSDKNKKNSILLQSEVYSQIFDKLNPVTFKYNDGTSDRTHTGLIAQEVEEAVLSSGLTTKDFAVVCYDVDEEGNKTGYGIRYEELVSMNIYEIQKLKARVAELEAKLENKEN